MKNMHCHKLVASVAVNAAFELYETMMGDDLYYSAWKARHPGKSAKALARIFVLANAEKCIPVARATLACQLRDPTISDEQKELIVEALALDSTLMKGRREGAEIIGTTTGEPRA